MPETLTGLIERARAMPMNLSQIDRKCDEIVEMLGHRGIGKEERRRLLKILDWLREQRAKLQEKMSPEANATESIPHSMP